MGLPKKQREFRKTGIGGSEIAALAGLSNWAAPIDIWSDKLTPATDDDESDNLRMELGGLFEQPMSRLYAKRTGKYLLKADSMRHPTRRFALATPDRLVYPSQIKRSEALPHKAERLLEMKTADRFARKSWGDKFNPNIPAVYYVQVQWTMDVVRLEDADLAVLFDRDFFDVYPLVRDASLLEGLHEIGERFWVDHVLTRKPPPPDASSRYAEYLGRLHPNHVKGKVVDATPEIQTSALNLRVLEAQGKAAEKQALLYKNQIKAFMGDAEELVGDFGKMTYRAPAPSRVIDWEGVARNLAQSRLVEELESSKERPDSIRQAIETRHRQAFTETVEQFVSIKPGTRKLLKQWRGEVSPSE